MSLGYVANGNINPSRAVKIDTTAGVIGKVVIAGAGERAIGIAQAGTRRVPGFTDDGYAAIAGETLLVWTHGDKHVPAELGGTVTQGDYLKVHSDGTLLSSSTDQDDIVAIAEAPGTAGKIIPVQVHIMERSTT